jgi:dephospho-CoA kinase
MQRNHLSVEQARNRINTQMPLTEKEKQADVILDNSTTQQALFAQVDWVMQQLLANR